jgi:hypothetical protein|tara:strand:- start:1405 stop:1590 length:186 start_codon:yes stop_codon:yes gene_type:complete
MTKQAVSNKEFVIESYRDLLHREPDAEGLQYWIDDLEKRGESRDDVLANIKLSDEYKAMDS